MTPVHLAFSGGDAEGAMRDIDDSIESADILTYNGNGKLIVFDTLADQMVPNRVFAR